MTASRGVLVRVCGTILVALSGAAAFVRIGGSPTLSTPGGPAEVTMAALETTAAGDAELIDVRGAAVVRGTLVMSISATGQAAAMQGATLFADVGGRVERVTVRESGRVRAGRLLVAIDSTQYALALADALARLSASRASFQEITLFDDKITDSSERAERASVARARSGLEGAEIARRRAEVDLAQVRLAAPFDGTIADIKVARGQIVKPGDALLTVQRTDPIKVEVQVLESEVGFLAAGRPAIVSFAAFPGKNFRGTVRTINPAVDQSTRAARVTVTLDNHDGQILPGMYARIALDARRFADRILVPRAAILERDRRTMLFVLERGDEHGAERGSEGVARWRYVTTGLANDSLIEIVRGPNSEMLTPGEVVLIEGHGTLADGARVRLVADPQSAAESRPW